eukprot:scaffold48501_cov30-Tisochrysis_lutea.AAC.1
MAAPYRLTHLAITDSRPCRYAESYTGQPAKVGPDHTDCLHSCGLRDSRLWATLFVKNAFTTIFFAAIFIASTFRKSRGEIWSGLAEAPVHIGLASLFQAAVNILFPLALLETTSARALMLISANPLWAAVLGRFVLKERMAWPTIVALCIALGAIALVFIPSLVGGATEAEGAIHGDIIAIITGMPWQTCLMLRLPAELYLCHSLEG